MARGHYESNDGFWVMLFACVLVLLVWNVLKPYAHYASLTSGYYQGRLVEAVVQWIPFVEGDQVSRDRKQIARTLNRGVHNLGSGDVFQAKRSTQVIFLSIVTVWFGFWGYRIYRRQPINYKKMLSLDELDIFISRFYYPSRSVVGRQLHLRHPLKDRYRRFARKPWEWAIEIGALRKDGTPLELIYRDNSVNLVRPDAKALSSMSLYEPNVRTALSRQLGARIMRVEDVLVLPVEYRAILVALLANMIPSFMDKFGAADKWLKQYSTSFWNLKALNRGVAPADLPPVDRDGLDITGCDEALSWALQHPTCRAWLSKSSYANSLLVHMMKKSSLATAKFVWLKVLNRTLFYALNNVGRPRRIYIEGHAPIAHAEYEQVCNSPQTAPYLNHSIEAIKQSLRANKWLPKT